MTKAAIFDLDGTLIDTGGAIVRMMAETVEEMGYPPVHEAHVKEMIGLPLEAGIARFLKLPNDHQHVAEAVRRYKARFHVWLVPQAPSLLFPGVPEGLGHLRGKAFKLGVATSKHRGSAEAILASAGILHHFDVVAGADTVSEPKPHPAMALHVADALACHPGDCVMVGDTRHDMLMGRDAGMATVAVTYGIGALSELTQTQPDLVAATFGAAVHSIVEGANTDQPLLPSRRHK